MNIMKRNNITVRGKGQQPMIFAHGYGCDQNMWRLVSLAFEEQYKVILFDHVGAGGSDLSVYDKVKYNRLQGYADDILDICRGFDLSNAIFVGHSVSAMIGILAAIKEPRFFKQLVLIGPSPCYINDKDYKGGFEPQAMNTLIQSLEKNFSEWAGAMAPVIMGHSERPELGQELVQSFCRTKPEIAKQFARVTFLSDHRQDLTKLKIPALIMQCSQDSIAPLSVGQYMHKTMPASELRILKATGHCPNLSAPAETTAVIKAFLSAKSQAA